MHVAVDGRQDLLVPVRLNVLFSNRLTVIFIDSGAMLSILGQEFRCCLLGSVHIDDISIVNCLSKLVVNPQSVMVSNKS